MKTYNTADMTDEEILDFWKKVRREGWIWTCNGCVLPPDEEHFEFKRSGHGDVLGLLMKDRRSTCTKPPVMG